MKPLMPPIDTPDQVFHDGNPSTGELGTICSAEWLNNVQANIRNIQAECIAILNATGFTPDSTNDGQLWAAIQSAIKNQVPAASMTTAGVTQLSSSVTSDSESVAATLKAVKIAMDNANARLAKERNLADLTNIPLARQSLQLGNSATRNVGTTANTVAAGDDSRILATKKAIDDTQTGLAVQGVMWISTADDLSNLPSGARRFARNNTGVTVLPAGGYFFLEVLAKRDTANGSCILATSDTRDVWIGFRYAVPDEANFTWIQLNQSVQDLGLADTVNRASHVYADGNIYGGIWGGWLSSYIQRNIPSIPSLTPYATSSWVIQNFVQNIDLTTPQTIQFWDGRGYPRGTDGAAMYNFMMVGGSSNVGWFEVRYTRVLINGSWRVIN